MALTQAQRQARSRAKKEGATVLPFEDLIVSREDIERRESQRQIDMTWAKAQDEKGEFYKGECRLAIDLFAIFYGADIAEKESDGDEETSSKKKLKKTSNHPNPSKQPIQIKAITYIEKAVLDGIEIELTKPIEPACWVGCDHAECGKDHRKDFEVNEVVSFQRWLYLRDKARKDSFWLGRLLGKGFFHSVHQYICDQYIRKDFDGLLKPGYDLEDYKEAMRAQKRFANIGTGVTTDGIVPTNELLLNEQRGGYKSTFDGIDCVSWVINRPEIRIMVITAFRQLAKKRAKEIKRYFFLAQRGTPSSFHMLFPEFITRGIAGSSDGPLECPANNKLFFKEPTMWFTSMESSATGDHCCILKGDDIVDKKNSADEEMREALKYDFDSRKTDLLDPWGFVDVTGTRYFTDDMYGARFVPNSESKRVSPFRYSCRGAWVLSVDDQILYNLPVNNPDKLAVARIIEEQRGKLVFPAKNNWTKLRNIYDEKGERNFKNQQMNEATDAADLSEYVNHFTKDNLVAHSQPKDSTPPRIDVWQLWDLAYSETSTSDFSVGVTIGVYQRPDQKYAILIMGAEFGKWKSSELTTKIALMYRAWPQTKGVLIEKSNGVEWLLDTIKAAGYRYNVPDIRAKIATFEIDNSKHAKRNRIKNLELLMFDERMHFIIDARWNDECFKQFSSFTGEPSNKARKDDFPDAISFIFKVLPRDVVQGNDEDPEKTRKEDEERRKKELLSAWKDRMFSSHNPTQPPPASPESTRTPQEDPRTAQLMKILPSVMRRRGV
jgi:phage terminase large subunit-like protein